MDNKENKPTRSISSTTLPTTTDTPTLDTASSRKSEASTSSTFRLGSFTKSLLAKAQTDESGLSPGTLTSLVNPMRSQLGLPCLSLFSKTVPPLTSPTPPEDEPTNIKLTPPTPQDNSHLSTKFTNLTFSHRNQPLPTVTAASITAPTPNKTFSGDNNTCPEIAAVIPTPKPKSKCLNKKNLNTPKSITHTNAKPLKSKEVKKPLGGGWKFSSEHIQGKEYLIIKQLGKGGCGEVLLVIEKESREFFALKRVNLSGIADASVEECVNEVQMLVDLRDSELVVHIYAWEFDKSEKTMKILMEHGQCDLDHSIKTKNWTCLKLRCIWERLLTIVDLIHRRGIVHADLKPANFIWSGDNLKIIDFGIASRLQSDHTSIAMLCPRGTLNFISPETIQPDSKISPKSDIWSLGCILYLMVYGTTPFEYMTHPVQKMTAIVKGAIDYPPIPEILASSAPEILSVLKLCFQLDYRRRPSASYLLQHPLINV